MDLSAWTRGRHGRVTELAEAVGVHQSFIAQISSGHRECPIARCMLIENATHGEVTRKDLRPHDWFLIWPELAEKEARKAAAKKKHFTRNNQENESGFHA